ncbi:MULTISPECIES: hypothetical protein [unclassified Butyrivibrio]|uniref:hypothetical protein n=1 Tax=unclassified Butyrivibrio TaxID=2639466 RepID=UPI0003B3B09F|nr:MULTISPECIES: hypothetical protein [unclassified Butyrivibrio]MDC7292504.1 hypothetical protein [Butyrivibrio sp. DSM 10294]
MTPLPDLQELERHIEANALGYAASQGVPVEHCIANRTVEMWCQMWPDESAGAAHTAAERGKAVMTEGYFTIFHYKFYDPRTQNSYELYSCTYGNNPDDGFLAMKEEMDEGFYEAWKNHDVMPLWQVLEIYQ